MRALLFAALLAAFADPSASQPNYHVVAQLPAGDGGWDLASVDPVDERLYIARSDGVTAIDLQGYGKDRARAARARSAGDPRNA
jgi:hypothetical protein